MFENNGVPLNTFNKFRYDNKLNNTSSKINYRTYTSSDTKTSSDRVQINGQDKTPKKKNIKNILLGIGATAIATLGAVYGVKKYQVKNIKNVQKAFQKTFMRDDITVEQTREMLKRYKEIEKISNREEYAKALFNEVKKNYGLEKSNIKLVFEDMKNASGFCARDNSVISITPHCSRSHIINTMHHEFRHAKQHNMVYNAYPEFAEKNEKIQVIVSELVQNLVSKNINLKPEDVNSKKLWEQAEKIYNEKGFKLTEKNKELYEYYKSPRIANFVPEKIRDKDREFVDRCKNAIDNYTSMDENFIKYFDNFTEKDARKAGNTVERFVRGNAFDYANIYDKIMRFLGKHTTLYS